MRFPEFTEEWRSHFLTDFMSFKNGMNPDAKRFGRGTKFISVMDILNNQFICYDNIRASVEVMDGDIDTYGVNYGDILFQRSSETLEDVGQANVYLDSKPAIFGGFVIRGKSKGNYNPLFFRYLLASPTARKRIIVKGAGAQHFNIGQDGLSKVSLDIPCMQEQKKIGELLQCIDARIATQNKIIDRLQSLIKGLTNQLLIPNSNWQPTTIGQVLTINSGKDYKHLKEGNIPVYGTGGYMLSVNDYLYDGESVCIGRKGTINKPIFLTGKFWTVDTLFYTSNFNSLLPRFGYYLFKTIDWLKYNEASGVPSLSKVSIEKIHISLPSLAIQNSICRLLDSIYDKLALEESVLNNHQTQKAFILQQMFI
ncbi:restriction endonuclease subunit S [Bacteroides fragilis]|uniref:restriction endonuclease subunit S n=1 Tax=Bacteroides TaxID=816 RepID=UPI00193E0723|nr:MULTISPECIES: restriction endonuclease subunit S [Bacteroides]MDV6178721.1 restriction endonuclease subunit S [Bacteroides hominis (ex Liu et al. 2022)]QRM70457.1 restriction endonuclease subunit S [Bacteroides fragilis]